MGLFTKLFGSSKPRQDIEEINTSAGTKMLIGQPANYPDELVGLLQKYFENIVVIRAAYLAQIQIPADGEPPHILIGIQFDGDPKAGLDAIAGELTGLVSQLETPLGPVDFKPVIGGPIDDYLITRTNPCYRRPFRAI
ncbi:MAG: enhanced serine sensitivity protein SseB C-terminal domain-containing protein [Clostridia bacterium]|nr:enhanced serine sensitivity protein SseB C-terminal domain-containing protein [Clostridia bacterium]